jgi:ERCC4-type nuclease
MEPFEVRGALEKIKLIADTREQNTKAFRQRIASIGFLSERRKLDFGDYSATTSVNGSEITFERLFVIERKMSLDELCVCYGRDRGRFSREFERARECDAKIYLLVENATMENALNGRYKSKLNKNAFIASIFAWLARYDCQLIFCKSESTAKVIREIIHREIKERLETMDCNDYLNRLREFESAKQALDERNLSAEEYQREIRRLSAAYDV